MKLSILTATYNRANFLKKLYTSIIQNLIAELDIEWLIMNDGSTDNTNDIVKEFKEVANLTIKYYEQPNGGKMDAINNLMNYVTGELVMDCDSDDYFVKNSFMEIYKKSQILLKDQNLYAILFLKNEYEGKLSGEKFKVENEKMSIFNLYFEQEATGEKIIVFDASIRKRYRHRLEDNEKFVTEARMYHQMDKDYGVKCFNIVIVEGKYLENGYTSNVVATFKKYPKGYYMYFKEILNMDMNSVTVKKRLYVVKHYILFEYLTKSKISIKNVKGTFNKLIYVLLLIPGRIKSSMFK